MKILQVMAGAPRGGAETAFTDMCIALHEAGESIEVVTRANDIRVPVLRDAGIRVHSLPFGGKIDVFTPWRLARIIKEFQPDIVQTWMARAAAAVPAWREGMGIPPYAVVARLGGYYKIKYFKSVDYFISITPDIRDYLIKNGVAPERVRQINNFAEAGDQNEAPLARHEYGVPEDAPLLVALGRLHRAKAFDVLIAAMDDVPEAHLWIAGEGPDRAALEKQIVEAGLEGRVKLLGWRTDRVALLKTANICVFPSRFEPFGTVFVQAWANRIPLVTTASDGPRQFVRDGEDGLIVPVDDAAALAAALNRMIADKDLRDAVVARGYERYTQEFTKEESLRRYLEYYHSMRDEIAL